MPFLTTPQNMAMAHQSQQPSLFSGLGNFNEGLRNNSGLLTMLGLALLDKRQNNQVPFSQVGTAALVGSKVDQDRMARQEDNTTRNMTVDWLVKNKGLSAQDAQVAVRNPTILGQYLGTGGNPTDDMREYDQARAQGFEGTFMDYMIKMKEAGRANTTVNLNDWKIPSGYQLKNPDNPSEGIQPIPGGPGEQIPAESAARIGMAENFLSQAPAIRQQLEAGAVTGPWDRLQAGNNQSSAQAQVYRQMKSGTDALQRMLTGAGMPAEEAKQYSDRYLPTYTDDAKSAAAKLDQLVSELKRIQSVILRGRGGTQEPTTPNGIDPQDWEFMTPEERALFQ